MTNGNSAALSQRQALEFIDAELTQYLEHMPMDETSRNLRDVARAALSVCADGGKGEAVAPAGWKLVPVYPTDAMMLNESTCQHHDAFDLSCTARENRLRIYNAMIAAAPQAECALRAECLIDKYSSRICENGTLSCDVEHPRADDGEIACDSCGLTMGQSRRLAAPIAPRADDGVSIIETPCHKEVGNHRIPKVAPRSDLMQVANRVAAEFRDLASKLPDDVLVKLFSRADADTAGAFQVSKEIIEAIQSYGDLRADRASNTSEKIGEVILMIRDALAAAGASNERAEQEIRAYIVTDRATGAKVLRWVHDVADFDPAKYQIIPLTRADAEKDAALTDASIQDIADDYDMGISDLFWEFTQSGMLEFARAILAANKEQQP